MPIPHILANLGAWLMHRVFRGTLRTSEDVEIGWRRATLPRKLPALRRAAAADPGSPVRLRRLADAYYALAMHADAVGAYRRLLEADPSDWRSGARLATSLCALARDAADSGERLRLYRQAARRFADAHELAPHAFGVPFEGERWVEAWDEAEAAVNPPPPPPAPGTGRVWGGTRTIPCPRCDEPNPPRLLACRRCGTPI